MALLRLGNTQKSSSEDGNPRVEVKEDKIRLAMQTVLDLGIVAGESYLDVAYDPATKKAYITEVPSAKEGERQRGRKLSSSRYLNSKVIAETLSKNGNHYLVDMNSTVEDDGATWYELQPTEAPEEK